MRILTAAFAAVAIAASAIAGPATAADIATFTPENVKAIVADAGGTNITTESSDGITFINFEWNGLPFSYSIRLCDSKGAGGCVGLLMAIGLQTEESYSLETLNTFNRNVALATVVQIDAKTIAFGRFVVSAGGITSDNVKANMVLVGIAPELFVRLLKSQVVASTDPAASGKTLPVNMPAPSAPKAIRLTPKAMNSIMDEEALGKLNLKK